MYNESMAYECMLDMLYISKRSVVVVECDYNQSVWNEIWKELKRFYDIVKPQKPSRIREMQRKLMPGTFKIHKRGK